MCPSITIYLSLEEKLKCLIRQEEIDLDLKCIVSNSQSGPTSIISYQRSVIVKKKKNTVFSRVSRTKLLPLALRLAKIYR